MLNLVRGSCKVITLESHDLSQLKSFIHDAHTVLNDGIYSPELLDDIFSTSNEGNTVVIVTDKISEKVREADMLYLFLLKDELEGLLANITNHSIKEPVVNKVKLSPRIILLRAIGDIEKVIKQVTQDVDGVTLPTSHALDNVATGTLIYFSGNALHKATHLNTTYETCVYTNTSYYSVFRYLRNQNLKYLNIGIDNTDWYELKIKIYDAYGHFDLHYNRMRYIFEKLEMGMILGETWGTDIASVFQTVGIYKVRFFTFKEPLEIKKILVGLEYLGDGERICDYDLYWKRKKYHWDQVRTETVKGKTELGVYYRDRIMSQLNHGEKIKMAAMEKEIRATKE